MNRIIETIVTLIVWLVSVPLVVVISVTLAFVLLVTPLLPAHSGRGRFPR